MATSKPNLSPHTKNLIGQFLLRHSTDGKINFEKAMEASQIFEVTRRTIFNIWADAKRQIEAGEPVTFISNKKGFSKTKRVKLDPEKMKKITFENRGTIRGLAGQLKVRKSTVCRWIKLGDIKAHTNSIKPELTPENKLQRLNYCLHQIYHDMSAEKLMFDEMYNVVHIDEKWFYMTKVNERYYIIPGEKEPHRTCKSKKFFTKVMFMCTISRPIFGSAGEVLFDGKIGIFPFLRTEPAKRKSKNRAMGTWLQNHVTQSTKK